MTNNDEYTEEGKLFEELTDSDAPVEDAQSDIDGVDEEPLSDSSVEPDEKAHNEIDSTATDPADEVSSEEVETASGVVDDHSDLTNPPRGKDGIIQSISWPGDRIDTSADERLLLATNPHPIKHIPQYLASVILILVSGFLSVHYLLGYTNDYLTSGELPFGLVIEVTTLYLLGLLGVMAIGVGVIVWIELARLHTWYILTNQRTWVRSGVLSRIDQGSPDHRSINNVKEQNPFPINRFGVGHIALYTASTDEREIDLRYVKNPQTWKSEIRTYIRSEQEKSSRDEQLLG